MGKGKDKLKEKLKSLMKDEVKAGQKALDEVFDKQKPTKNDDVNKAVNKLSKDASGVALDVATKAATDPTKAKQAATDAVPKLAETGIKGAGEIAKGALVKPIKNLTDGLGDAKGPVGTLLKGATGAVIDNVLGFGSDLAVAGLNDLLDGKHIGALNMLFMTWNDQDKKLIYDRWYVENMEGTERLGETYAIFADLSARHKDADVDSLLGTSVWLWGHRSKRADKKVNDTDDTYYGPSINDDISWGGFCGIVDRIDKTSSKTVRVRIVPAFDALRHTRNTRIFQEKSVVEIVKDAIGPSMEELGRALRFELDCHENDYAKREYCVQFDESDLDFAIRVLEEEGFTFYFRQPTDHPIKLQDEDRVFGAESLVITDRYDGFGQVRTRAQIDDEWTHTLELNTNKGNRYTGEAIEKLRLIEQRSATQVVVRDYDWTNPATDFTKAGPGAERESLLDKIYTWKPKLTFHEYSADDAKYKASDLERQAEGRAGDALGHGALAIGASRVADFSPGLRFTLKKHKLPELNTDYVVRAVKHKYDSTVDRDGEKPGTYIERYTNEFEAIPTPDSGTYPSALRYVPPRTKTSPRVYGIQTARVVGPDTDDPIYTDEHGRIKVQFHWDRLGARNEQSSCWIRVGQAMAGAGFGFVFLPRIGMEVIVQFIDGDPDRPLVTGAVYNGENRPPVTVDDSEDGASSSLYLSAGSAPCTSEVGITLPDNKTRSFIRTQSVPAQRDEPNAYNELSFEDAAGSEQIYIQAQKDFVEYVKHDRKAHVANDDYTLVDGMQRLLVVSNREKTIEGNESVRVGGNRTEQVFKNESLTVDGNRTRHVDGSEAITIDKDRARHVKGNDTVSVDQERKVTVTKKVTETYSDGHEQTVGGSAGQTITVTDGDQVIHAHKDRNVRVVGHESLNSKTRRIATDDGELINMDEYGTFISSSGKSVLTLNGEDTTLNTTNLTINGEAAGELKLVVGASEISIAASGIEIKSGACSIKVDAAGVTVTGVPVINMN